jgi:hypothetical protein
LWQGLGSLFRSVALVIGSFRLVEVNVHSRDGLSFRRSELEHTSYRPHNI